MHLLFITPLITGLIYLAVGLLLKKRPPKNPNHIYGYRTTASRKSQESWDMAQLMSGNILFNQGVALCALAFLSFVVLRYIPISEIVQLLLSLGIIFGLLIYLFAKVELTLRNHFD